MSELHPTTVARCRAMLTLRLHPSVDPLCQRGRVQEGGGHGASPSGRQNKLSPTQRPRVHPHAVSLSFQLRGVFQASVARLQASSGFRVPPLPRQVPQGPPRQKGGCYCSLQR